jgi:endonuclease/exonuclease/phosphatase (EEP) superfamily protein YafD
MRIGAQICRYIRVEQPDPQPGNARSRVINLILYAIAIPSIVVCGCAWMLSSSVYLLDMLVSQQMLLAWWALGVLVGLIIMRRWKIALLALVMCVLAFYPVMHGRTLRLPRVEYASKPEGVIRVVSCNINPENEQWEEALDDLMRLDADVIVLLEVPAELSRSIRNRGLLDRTLYPYWAHRYWVEHETTPCFLLARHPISETPPTTHGDFAQHILHARIEQHEGSYVVGLAHPSSPRGSTRWVAGNRVTQAQAATATLTARKQQIPLLICADLNAGPAQLRARVFRGAGLRQSKPLTRYGGSFPAQTSIPRALRVQLDDVWTLGDAHVIAWDSFEVLGSDHQAIVVDIRLGSMPDGID